MNIKNLIVLLFLVFFMGCLGSDDSGTSQVSRFSYHGKTTPAVITADNAEKLVHSTFVFGNESSSEGANKPFVNSKKYKQVVSTVRNKSDVSTDLTRKETLSFTGAVSGSMTVEIDIIADGIGTYNTTWDNYNDGDGETTDGKASYIIRVYNREADVDTESTIIFKNVSIKDSKNHTTFNGSVDLNVILESNTETEISNAEAYDHNRKKWYKLENLIAKTYYEDYTIADPIIISDTATGRIYDSEEGYVDISTESPTTYDADSQDYFSGGGPVFFIGAGNSQIKLIPFSAESADYEVDADGDDIFEISNTIIWIELEEKY